MYIHQERQTSKSTRFTCEMPRDAQFPCDLLSCARAALWRCQRRGTHRTIYLATANSCIIWKGCFKAWCATQLITETLWDKMRSEQPIAMTGIFSGSCSTQLALGVEWHDFAILTLCCLKVVKIFELCRSGMRSTCHPFLLPTVIFFLFPLSKRQLKYFYNYVMFRNFFVYRRRLHKVLQMVWGS